jgi:hypothetical protein
MPTCGRSGRPGGSPRRARADAGLFVWGGDRPAADGALYDHAAQTWRLLPEAAPQTPPLPHAVVWTGEEVLVWGGTTGSRDRAPREGAAYDPATDTWRQLADAPAAVQRAVRRR